MTFKQFTESKQSPEYLADIFIRYYERPYNPNQPSRQTQARYWFNLLNQRQSNVTKGETTMQCIYWKPNAQNTGEDAYYFNGVSSKYIPHPDSVSILKTIYKDNNGKDMPEYHWEDNAPWWIRLEAVCVEQ